MKKDFTFTDEYIIKNKRFKIEDYLYIVISIVALYFILESKNNLIYTLFSIGIIVFTILTIVKRHIDRKNKLIIDKKGITICEENTLIEWENINYAYINQKTIGVGKGRRSFDCFYINLNEDNVIEIDMSGYSFNKEMLTKYVEYFSGRNIGEFEDLLNDKTKKKIGSKRYTEQISKLFTNYYKSLVNLATILFVLYLGISVYLLVVTDLTYAFAIGFTLYILILLLVEKLLKKRLRNREYINELDDDTFNELIKEYKEIFDRHCKIFCVNEKLRG